MPYPPLFSVLSKPFVPLVFNHSLQNQDALILGCLSGGVYIVIKTVYFFR